MLEVKPFRVPVRGDWRDITPGLILDAVMGLDLAFVGYQYVTRRNGRVYVNPVGALALMIEPRFLETPDFMLRFCDETATTRFYVNVTVPVVFIAAYNLPEWSDLVLSDGFAKLDHYKEPYKKPYNPGGTRNRDIDRHLFEVGREVARRTYLTWERATDNEHNWW
jgi:hypothetical protein